MNNDTTRLFFVVDSKLDNEEIFTTLEEAKKYFDEFETGYAEDAENDEQIEPRIYIALVRNSYYDKSAKAWNYEDYSDTFEVIKVLKGRFADLPEGDYDRK